MRMPGFLTLLYKELLRFWKVSFQTIAAPMLTSLLYLLIFSHALESRVAGLSRRGLCELSGSRAGHDVAAAERVRQQLFQPDPIEDHREYHLRAAHAADTAGDLFGLRAGRYRPRRGGRRWRTPRDGEFCACAGPAPACGR